MSGLRILIVLCGRNGRVNLRRPRDNQFDSFEVRRRVEIHRYFLRETEKVNRKLTDKCQELKINMETSCIYFESLFIGRGHRNIRHGDVGNIKSLTSQYLERSYKGRLSFKRDQQDHFRNRCLYKVPDKNETYGESYV